MVRPVARDQLGERQPDVAAGGRLQPGVRQEVRRERGRRALAVRAGDADQDPLQEPRGQLDLATMRTPWRRASAIGVMESGTPGLTAIRSASTKVRASCLPA